MSANAIANGGGVVAGGLVATAQSIGAAGLVATTGPAIVVTGAAVGVGFALWASTASAASAAAASSTWASPAVLVGVGVIAGAAVGGGVVWIVCWLVEKAIRYLTFDDKEKAHKAFDELPATSNKVLIDPEKKIDSSDIIIYSKKKKWILLELCAEAGDCVGEIQQHIFDDEGKARKAFDESPASNKGLVDFGGQVLLHFPAMLSSE
ncbi:hypothetical protein V7S43_000153 [Phytophthora oleae]|uniref:Uncharacterized protein n=1 Tax=Phytophthora oleae TaxID=2107226 RepID=A0ABD3G4Y4_9STRA